MKNALCIVLACVSFICFIGWVKHTHSTNGECGGVSGCGWCWCKHYDGRDFLHDFNF